MRLRKTYPMKYYFPRTFFLCLTAGILFVSCAANPYAATNRLYKKQAKAYARSLRAFPAANPAETGYPQGDYPVAATNFNMRKPNYVIIHHTAQHTTAHTLKTFTTQNTRVSAHYVIGRDGKVYQMFNDYLRAWHAGLSKWGNNTDINYSSIGIELDNNGAESFPDAQINSLLQVLAALKQKHDIPTANFIGHSDIAPKRKVDPNPTFPWKQLAKEGYGLWYDEDVLKIDIIAPGDTIVDTTIVASADSAANINLQFRNSLVFESVVVHEPVPEHFDVQKALRIIGYDISEPEAAVRAFKLHFIQKEINAPLTEAETKILHNLYQKYL